MAKGEAVVFFWVQKSTSVICQRGGKADFSGLLLTQFFYRRGGHTHLVLLVCCCHEALFGRCRFVERRRLHKLSSSNSLTDILFTQHEPCGVSAAD